MKLLKFSASWCGPCKSLSAVLSNMTLPASVESLEEVDIDEQQEFTAQYQIRGVPTIVALNGGKEIGRFSGTKSESDIVAWISALQ